MAHTKAQRAVKGNRDSISKRRGVKVFGGQTVEAGNVIIRQKGTLFNAGEGALLARDFTIMATQKGTVEFYTREGKKYVRVI